MCPTKDNFTVPNPWVSEKQEDLSFESETVSDHQFHTECMKAPDRILIEKLSVGMKAAKTRQGTTPFLDEDSMPTINGGGRRGNCTAFRTWLLCCLGWQTLNAGQLMHFHPVPMAINSSQHLKVGFDDA